MCCERVTPSGPKFDFRLHFCKAFDLWREIYAHYSVTIVKFYRNLLPHKVHDLLHSIKGNDIIYSNLA